MTSSKTLESTRYGAGNRNIADTDFSIYHRDQVVNSGVDTVADFRLTDWEFQKCILVREMGAIYTYDPASTAADDGDAVLHDNLGRRYLKGAFDGAAVPGTDGAPGGSFAFAFDGASQTMADPGPGLFRLNNATPASATAMALAADLSDSSDVSALITARLQSTSTVKARLVVTNGTNRLEYDVTGVSDNGAWVQLTLDNGSIVGSLSDEAPCALVFSETGDRGDDGQAFDHNGVGVPSNGLGEDGETYLNIANGDTYIKAAGDWGSPSGDILATILGDYTELVNRREFESVADLAAATIAGTTKRVRTAAYDPLYADLSTMGGGCDHVRISKADFDSAGFPDLALTRSQDRLMPDGVTVDATNGGYWLAVATGAINIAIFGARQGSASYAERNSAALQAALDYWVASPFADAVITSDPGTWRFDPSSFVVNPGGPFKNITIEGDGRFGTTWETELSGTDSIFLDNSPGGVADRNCRFYLRRIKLVSRNADGTVCPIFVRNLNWLEGCFEDVGTVQGSQGQIGNTHTVLSGIWNADIVNCHSNGGGLYVPANPLSDTVRFTLTADSAIVEATEAVFSEDDEGIKFIFGPEGGAWVGTVASYDSPTQVTMTEPSPYSSGAGAEIAYSEPIRATTTASGTTVTVNRPRMEESHVGRYVVIRGAGTSRSRRSFHRAKILSVAGDGLSFTMDRPAVYAVSPSDSAATSARGAMAISPVHLVLYDGNTANTTNDITFINFRIELFRGVGLVIEDGVQLKFTEQKIHGDGLPTAEIATGYRPDYHSQAGMWIQSRGGFWKGGSLEAAGFDDGRIVCSGSEQFKVNDVCCRCNIDQAILFSEHPYGQFAEFRLGDALIYNQQWDMTTAGLTSHEYIAGRGAQVLEHIGSVNLSSTFNKRLASGNSTANSGGAGQTVSNGVTLKIKMPPTRRNDGLNSQGSIEFFLSDASNAKVGFTTNGAGYHHCTLSYGGSLWAVSDTPEFETTGKITVSCDDDYIYVVNDSVSRFMTWDIRRGQ